MGPLLGQASAAGTNSLGEFFSELYYHYFIISVIQELNGVTKPEVIELMGRTWAFISLLSLCHPGSATSLL